MTTPPDRRATEDLGCPPQDVLDAWAKDCRCCTTCCPMVCGGVQQGAPCEEVCHCGDDYDSMSDEYEEDVDG